MENDFDKLKRIFTEMGVAFVVGDKSEDFTTIDLEQVTFFFKANGDFEKYARWYEGQPEYHFKQQLDTERSQQ